MKRCSKCLDEKELSEFSASSRSNDGKQAYCRACASLYYRNNSVKHKASVAARNKDHRAWLYNAVHTYLLDHPCVDCGETDPVVLEFDHVRGTKVDNVSTLIRRSRKWEVVKEEIAKCDVRCANCHKRKTAKDFGYIKLHLHIKYLASVG